MKQLALALFLLGSGSAFAQEIGTEITPSTPPPTPPAEQKGGYVYKPKGSENASADSGQPGFTGTKVSASSGDFGIRAGFGGGATVPSLTATAAAPLAAPSVGIAYFAGDAFKLLLDLGFGLVLSSNPSFAMSATVGFDYLFRTPAEAMRPFIHAAASFLLGGNGSTIGLGAQLGFGAEYFFTREFAVNARLLLAVPMALSNSFLVGLFTFQPGVGGTWYF